MTTTERFVIDTNVLVSLALRQSSVPGRAARHVLDHHKVVATEAVLAELITVLRRPKFDRYVSRADCEQFLLDIQQTVIITPVLETVRACTDPADDKFLEAAVNGGAGAIITGDRALLALDPFRGIAIITPGGYLRRAGLLP